VGRKKKKAKRKDDVKKARSIYDQYLAHQDKVNAEPDSLAVPHWRKEKIHFLSKVKFYLNRARVEIDDIIK
jgi:hypothetical protein